MKKDYQLMRSLFVVSWQQMAVIGKRKSLSGKDGEWAYGNWKDTTELLDVY